MANKRIMKKHAISKAAAQAKTLDIEQLTQTINQLQAANEKLIKQLEQLKAKDVQNQKTINKLRGKIQITSAQLKTYRGSVKKLSLKVIKLKRQAIATRKGFGRQIQIHRTRAQYLTEVKSSFIARFISRLQNAFNLSKPEDLQKLNEISIALEGLNYEQIDDLVDACKVSQAYYESQVYHVDNDTSFEFVYQLIVGLPEDTSEITQYIPETISYDD